MLSVKNVSVSYGTYNVLRNISFDLPSRSWLMIVGPNGAGKSTLLSALSQNIQYNGTVTFNGCELKKMRPRERAKRIGLLSQSHNVSYAFTVKEIVNMGRYAYLSPFRSSSALNEDLVKKALSDTGMDRFSEQSVLTLSGGELQRTFFAQLLAQDPEVMLLDEPANHLDLIYQRQLFSLITDWINKTGRSVISVVHDLSLAGKFGTHAMLLNHGECFAFGEIKDVLTVNNLRSVYGLDVYEWLNELNDQWRQKK